MLAHLLARAERYWCVRAPRTACESVHEQWCKTAHTMLAVALP